MKKKRLLRSLGFRKKIANININRLSVYKSNRYIYSQITSTCGNHIISSASSLSCDLRDYIRLNYGFNLNRFVCAFVAKCISANFISLGLYRVVFDRSGYRYHGCIKSFADSARKNGLKF